MTATYAIFTRRERGTTRVMHAVREGEQQTVCQLPIGRGSGLVRDGDYHDNRPCPRCWPGTTAR
jgi:hypothetical protein